MGLTGVTRIQQGLFERSRVYLLGSLAGLRAQVAARFLTDRWGAGRSRQHGAGSGGRSRAIRSRMRPVLRPAGDPKRLLRRTRRGRIRVSRPGGALRIRWPHRPRRADPHELRRPSHLRERSAGPERSIRSAARYRLRPDARVSITRVTHGSPSPSASVMAERLSRRPESLGFVFGS